MLGTPDRTVKQFPRSMNIWNRLPFSAVSHVIPSVDNFHKFAIPAIRVIILFFIFCIL